MKKLILGFVMFLYAYALQAADYYWTGGNGNWSDFANHWATTSGGTSFHTQSPTASDNVYFDANSFSAAGQAVSLDQPGNFCKNFTWQNALSGSDLITPDTLYHIRVLGSFFADAKLSYNGTISFEALTAGNTIYMQDTMSCIITMNHPAGSWALSTDLKTKGTVKLISGTFSTNNYNITCFSFISNYSTSNRTLNLGTSSVTIKAFQYDAGGGPVFISWYLDNVLTITGSATEIHFEIPDDADTTGSAFVFATDITFRGGNHDYTNIDGFAPGWYGTYIIVLSTSLHFGISNVNTIKFDNSTYTDIFYNRLHADSIILTGDTDPQLYIGFSDTLVADYIEAGATNIGTPRYSLIKKMYIKSDFITEIPNLGGLPDNINIFNDLYVQGDFTESNSSGFGFNSAYFKKCVINGNGTFNDSCTFDTLMLHAGKTYVIGAGQDITVNNNFVAFGTAGNFIQVNSDQVGTQAGINFTQGNVCSDYLVLRDINAIGTNIIAGVNSMDLGGNAGWQFAPCSVVSNVWPGDANYDLVVNNLDLLNVGLAFGETGPVRAGASNNYIAQPATDWSSYFISAVNKKHADCDGNGIIDDDDTLAISLNYGLTHPARLAQNEQTLSSGIELSFQFPTGAIVPGSAVNIPLILGSSSVPADSIYGIAFTVNYDPSFINPGSMYADYTGSWIGSTGNSIHLEKDFSAIGKFEVVFTRTDHYNVSGFGLIGMLNFIVANNAVGLMYLSFSNVMAVTNTGTEIPLLTNTGSIATSVENIQDTEQFSFLYPNPFHDWTEIVFSNPEHKKIRLTVSDISGKEILYKEIHGENKIMLEGNNLSKGMFLYELKTEDEKTISRGKFVVN